MKTQPMRHQVEGEKRLLMAPQYYALGCEQGTGKTWMLLNDAEQQFNSGRIQGLLVIAPKGVHINWVCREVPKHLSIDHFAVYWRPTSGTTKKHRAQLERMMREEPGERLVIFAMNVDAVNTPTGLKAARAFLRRFESMMVVDESQRIKNSSAKRTKKINALGDLAKSRRIASGTLVPNSPIDLFSQYEFLRSGLLGTTSLRSFTAEYAELLPPTHPLVAEVRARSRGFKNPQIVATDYDGRPRYRNLDKLRRLLAPHTYRVTKEECLDLPDKIYQTHYYELSAQQQRLYNQVRDEMRFERDDGEVDIYTALTMINKLQQITSGFIMVEGQPHELVEHTARLAALSELAEDCEKPLIVWATFREEIKRLRDCLNVFNPVVYYGDTSPKDREAAIDQFQSGDAQVFIANPAAAGVGLTLTAARTVIYYSCSYNLEHRLQSEDRSHRIGTKHHVTYYDIVARGTIDEDVARTLQMKREVALEILNEI